ncbi:MAG: AI-2E family transporter YdiK [Pantoea sp. Brub]|nr:AI-2E family transporter YdiK [Pantoea sp. Brub]
MNIVYKNMDITQIFFTLLFIILLMISCLWIIEPFILSFSWASMIVIATWPIMIKSQKILWGNRFLAVLLMITLLLLLFIIPITLIVNILVDNITLIMNWTKHNHKLPELTWLNNIPIFGKRLFYSYNKILSDNTSGIMLNLTPYINRITSFFLSQITHLSSFLINVVIMLLFSTVLYFHGEKVSKNIIYFSSRIAGNRGKAVISLAVQSIRGVALGVVVTSLIQGILAGIGLSFSGIPYAIILTILMIFFCLIQLSSLLVLIPAIIYLYCINNNTLGTILLVWSIVVVILDNVLRLMLIRIRANLPLILILPGVIGGLIAFGMIGLFIGPIVLAISYRLILAWMYEVPFLNHHLNEHRKK